MSHYFPAFLDLTGKRCLVVGGGPVATRKVEALLECSADVLVISPRLEPGLECLSRGRLVTVRHRSFLADDVSGAFLVIAATGDPETNRHIAAAARQAGALVNVVDQPEFCDFVAPAVSRRGDLTVAFSTGGRSPAVAAYLRRRWDESLAGRYDGLLQLVAEVRAELRAAGERVPAAVWREALDEELVDLLIAGRSEEARSRLKSKLVSSRCLGSRGA